jgi:hypothetical protein
VSGTGRGSLQMRGSAASPSDFEQSLRLRVRHGSDIDVSLSIADHGLSRRFARR